MGTGNAYLRAGVSTQENGWELPAFDQHEFERGTRSRFVVGVPVLNEGERLRAQLRTMDQLDLGADIVVADGGSTDGSVEPAFLRASGVRALLVKRGPGGLSAQLRMLFAWALRQGYEGVVTIDGNGKDGIEGVVAIREKLECGFDFVQGSRYLRDGRHANTPLDRHIGVRLVHAPLISLAARFRYTDTTNGLRGWSARALRDERVAAFRNVFETYSLHYYLSVRLPRLGYRVCEVPVERSYPERGPTPSKLKGWRARARLLRLLWRAARGGYDPPSR